MTAQRWREAAAAASLIYRAQDARTATEQTALVEFADTLGGFARAVTYDEALFLAKQIMPDETNAVHDSLAVAIRNKSLRDVRRG